MTTAQQVARRLDAKGPFKGGWYREAVCPYHGDTKGSLNFSESGFNCFGCPAKGHINKLAEDLGIREPTDFKRKTKDTHTPSPRLSEFDAMSRLETDRHLRPETIKKFGIQADEARQAYVYTDPAWPEETQRLKSFNGSSPRYSWYKYEKDEVDLYGLEEALRISSANNEQRVTLVEGEPDVWTMAQAGLAAVSFTGGATTVPDGAVEVLARNNFTHVTVIYDLDDPGLDGSWKASAALEAAGMTVRVLRLPETLGEKADVSTLYAHVGADDARFRAELDTLEEAPKPSSAPTLEDRDTSDADNASRLIDLHGDVLRFVPPWKKWLVFSHDKQRWIRDDENVHVFECAKDVGQNLKREALTIVDSRDAKKKFDHGLKCLSRAGIESMVKLARGIEGVPLDHELLDSDAWKLGVKNGVVDLRSGELRPAVPDDLMTMQCAVAFDPNAECPNWDTANEDWFPDPEVRKYVQRVAGSALVGVQRDHAFIIMYGEGRNGKGTFIRALQGVLGAYATMIHLSLLTKNSKEHDTVKASLFRSRFAVASETEHRVQLDEASVKNLTGRDRINCHRMREDEWEFDPSHSLWLQTNYLPKISGTDTGIWSRIRVVEWVTTFAPEEQVQDLDETLAGEAPGILNWLLAGCLSWQEEGLNEPEAVVRATAAYRDREDAIKLFISDAGLALDPSLEITSPELQALLEDWSTEAGMRPPQSALKTFLENAGCTKKNPRIDGKRVRVWDGFGVQQTEEDDEYERDEREGMQQH